MPIQFAQVPAFDRAAGLQRRDSKASLPQGRQGRALQAGVREDRQKETTGSRGIKVLGGLITKPGHEEVRAAASSRGPSLLLASLLKFPTEPYRQYRSPPRGFLVKVTIELYPQVVGWDLQDRAWNSQTFITFLGAIRARLFLTYGPGPWRVLVRSAVLIPLAHVQRGKPLASRKPSLQRNSANSGCACSAGETPRKPASQRNETNSPFR